VLLYIAFRDAVRENWRITVNIKYLINAKSKVKGVDEMYSFLINDSGMDFPINCLNLYAFW
jgi:hypothetical protein